MKQGNPGGYRLRLHQNQIVTKAIYPGTRIVEEDLVRETGVEARRTPVRSALMRLTPMTVSSSSSPNRGAVVAKPPPPRIAAGRCMRHRLCW